MNIGEAADRLRQMTATAPDGEKVAHIHLFGIRYAEELHGMNLDDLLT